MFYRFERGYNDSKIAKKRGIPTKFGVTVVFSQNKKGLP
jgi:hypothetical protein